jgi:hypothetical protein
MAVDVTSNGGDMTEKRTVTRRDLETAVVTKALADGMFRAQLTENPRSAVTTVLSELDPRAQWPNDVEIKAITEPQNAFYVVIPHTNAGSEFSDAELERVAGGICVSVEI